MFDEHKLLGPLGCTAGLTRRVTYHELDMVCALHGLLNALERCLPVNLKASGQR